MNNFSLGDPCCEINFGKNKNFENCTKLLCKSFFKDYLNQAICYLASLKAHAFSFITVSFYYFYFIYLFILFIYFIYLFILFIYFIYLFYLFIFIYYFYYCEPKISSRLAFVIRSHANQLPYFSRFFYFKIINFGGIRQNHF